MDKMTRSYLYYVPAVITILFLTQFSYTQTGNEQSIKLNSIQVNGFEIPESELPKISLTTNDKVSISYSHSNSKSKEVFYKIFLNGIKVEPEKRITSDNYTFQNFTEGTQIIRIQAYDIEGWESTSYILKFTVQNPVTEIVDTQNVKTENETLPVTSDQSFMIYILSGISLTLLIVVVILFLNRSKKEVIKVVEKPVVQTTDSKLENSLHQLKEIIESLTDENSFLKEKVKELESNITDLESANLNLVEQKEKFAEGRRQLEELHAQKEELFAIAVHDIKNPASAIKSYIDLLNSYDLNATEQQEIMSSLISSSEDIVKLTQQMCLVIAKDKPDITLKYSMTSIKKIIEKTFAQNLSYARTKKVKLINKCENNLPELKLNETKIEEVIDNLLNNAIKFAPPDTIVEIRSLLKDNSLIVEVADNGVGLSKEDQARAFQKGATLSSHPTGLEHSSGLGLWIAKKMVEEHSGKIWVSSKIGEGSTFSFSLPLEK